MSFIQMMQIRGIRSFSPESDENIEFYSPLTMIVGANGCGKTTIIESLKFACTGALPPNTKSGQSMINDPGMTDAAEVKAHIKLRFKNRNEHTCVVTRALQVSKKRTKLEYKALEAALSTLDLQGKKSSISMKCGEVDRIIPENLGVSSAILENVIFVHQEDSNWPMQEGMVLKKRFDDIFESTRYTKALDALMKSKKEFQAKAKDIKTDLAELSAHLSTAKRHEQELASCVESQESCEDSLKTLQGRLDRIDDRIRQSKAIVDSTQAQAAELQRLQWAVGEAERRVLEKERGLEQRLDASDEELQRMINNFESTMTAKNRELGSLNSNVQAIKLSIGKMREEVTKLSTKKGQAELLQEQIKQSKKQQSQLARELSTRYPGLPTVNEESSPHALSDLSQALVVEMERAQQEIREQVNRARNSLQEVDRIYQRLRSQVQEVEVELKLKADEDSAVLAEWDTKRLEKTRLASAGSATQRAVAECDNAQRNHDEFMQQFTTKSADLKRQIKEATDQIHSLQEDINSGAQLLQELSLHRKEITAMEAAENQINNEINAIQSDVDTLFAMNREWLRDAVTPTSSAKLELFLEEFLGQPAAAEKTLKEAAAELTAKRSAFAGKEALLKQQRSYRDGLRSKEQEYDGIAKQMRDLIPQLNTLRNGKVLAGASLDYVGIDISPKDLVDIAKATEDESRELLVIAKSGKVFLKRIKKMKEQNPNNCPCCGQVMADASVRDGFAQRVKTLFSFGDEEQQGTVEEHKETLTESQRIFENLQRLYVRLLPLQSVKEEAKAVDQVILNLMQEKHDLEDQLRQTEGLVTESEKRSSRLSKIYSSLQDLYIRWKAVEQRALEVSDRRKRQSQSYLTSSDLGGMSYEQLEHLQRDRMEKKDHFQLVKERAQNEESLLNKRSYQVKNVLSEATQALANAKLEGKKAEDVDIFIAKLQNKHEELDTRKKVLNSERDRLNRELAEVQVQLNSKRSEAQQVQEKLNSKMSTMQSDRENLEKISKQVDDLSARFAEADMERVNATLQEVYRSIESKEQEMQGLTPRISSINAELSSQEHTRRNIAANLDLRANKVELRDLQDQLREKEDELGGGAAQLTQAQQAMQQAQREREAAASERDTLRGKLEIHRQRVLDLNNVLSRAPYKGVEELHRKKFIEHETTNMAVTDLENYYAALDGALQSFHTLKIREINKIIRELWQLIYQGQDIDTIEIESGSDGAESAVASSSRSYNYRVVMKKGDVPLDMRGRCSAGQKALASIVIRLALAETFCIDCGILALDEPSTNLDEANKHGLAQALTRLIMSRAKQQNFQLIAITHDEDFVQTMRTELATNKDFNLPEYYFRVFREEDGNSGRFFSHIERIPWEDM